jgi:hypothetical protein
MISPQYLVSMFNRNTRIIGMQINGLTHDDSLLQPPFYGNCMNWVIGHIVRSRGTMLKNAFGLSLTLTGEQLQTYDKTAITEDGPHVLKLEQLLEGLAETQQLIEQALSSTPVEKFTESFGDSGTLGEYAVGFYFHDTYHTGQTEQLRQLTGVNDKVIG